MSMAKGVERIEEFAQAEQLEQRHKVLAEQLDALNREGPGFRQDLKAELDKLAYDLTTSVEDAITWIDANYRGDRSAR